jgi:hypothetical protein
MGDKANAYWVLVGKPEGNRLLIKVDFRETGLNSCDSGWCFVNAVMNLWVA